MRHDCPAPRRPVECLHGTRNWGSSMSVPYGLETSSVEQSTRPRPASSASTRGMIIDRRFTAGLKGQDPLEATRYEKRRSVIANPDGSVVFSMDNAEVPTDWSQLATD